MKRIAVIGPESTGKSTLCQQLAEHYQTVWCPEYARAYLVENGTEYNLHDLTKIAQGQLALEEHLAAEASNGVYIIDTEMYVLKVWHEVEFNQCPTWILKYVAQAHYDLYLLCQTDLPWEKDALREYPDLDKRQRLYKMYKDCVLNSGIPWGEVSGTGAARLQSAIDHIEAVLKK